MIQLDLDYQQNYQRPMTPFKDDCESRDSFTTIDGNDETTINEKHRIAARVIDKVQDILKDRTPLIQAPILSFKTGYTGSTGYIDNIPSAAILSHGDDIAIGIDDADRAFIACVVADDNENLCTLTFFQRHSGYPLSWVHHIAGNHKDLERAGNSWFFGADENFKNLLSKRPNFF